MFTLGKTVWEWWDKRALSLSQYQWKASSRYSLHRSYRKPPPCTSEGIESCLEVISMGARGQRSNTRGFPKQQQQRQSRITPCHRPLPWPSLLTEHRGQRQELHFLRNKNKKSSDQRRGTKITRSYVAAVADGLRTYVGAELCCQGGHFFLGGVQLSAKLSYLKWGKQRERE